MSTNRDADVVAAVRELAHQVGLKIELGRRTCLNCFYFNETKERCDKYNARPPARVIAEGCNDFDKMPF